MALIVRCEPGHGVMIDNNTLVGIQKIRGKKVELVVITPDNVRVVRAHLPPDPQGIKR